MFRGALHCAIALSFCNPFVVIGISPAPTNAANFAVRKVTDFGDPVFGSWATPLGVVGDHLLFTANDNGRPGLYRTDGTSYQLVDQFVDSFDVTLPYETAILGNELLFSGDIGNGMELLASDGNAVRQVSEIAAGTLSSNPRNFQTLNGRLLFNATNGIAGPGMGTSTRFFSTDGTTVEEFSITNFPNAGFATLEDRFVFLGIPIGGGFGELYSTDGESLTLIDAATVKDNYPGITGIRRIGDHAYVLAEKSGAYSIYRTDGQSSEEVISLSQFMPQPSSIAGIFGIDGQLHFAIHDRDESKFVFYRQSDSGVVETVLEHVPEVYDWVDTTNPNPFYIDEDRAYFAHDKRGVYAYDGSSFEELIDFGSGFYVDDFVSLGGRFLVNTARRGDLIEYIDGNEMVLGPGLQQLTLFNDELFGVFSDSIFLRRLMHSEEGKLVPLGEEFRSLFDASRFIEFNGQLYFRGGDGSEAQLYAIVPVPEPTSLAVIAAGLLMCGVTARRQRRSI